MSDNRRFYHQYNLIHELINLLDTEITVTLFSTTCRSASHFVYTFILVTIMRSK